MPTGNTTVVFVGKGQAFLSLAASNAFKVDRAFRSVRELRLDRAYQGLQKLKFVEALKRGGAVRSFYDRNDDVIEVFPLAHGWPQGTISFDAAIWEGMGRRHFDRNVNSAKRILWNEKRVQAERPICERVQEAAIKNPNKSFVDIVKDFRTSLERIHAIHIFNALQKSNVRASDLAQVSVFQQPSTRDFCTGIRPFSLTPLLSVYWGPQDIREYGAAFAQFVEKKGDLPISELSAREATLELFRHVSEI